MLKGNCSSPENGYERMYEYESKFIRKIELAKDLSRYSLLEQTAQRCLNNHTGCGFSAILAMHDMDRIIAMTDEQFMEEAKAFLAKHPTTA